MRFGSRALLASLVLMSVPAAGQDNTSGDDDTAPPPPPAEAGQEGGSSNPSDGPQSGTARSEPVVVTARKWKEFAQDVPQSLSVITDETIEDAGITNVREAAQLVPNLHMTEFSSRRLSFPTLRGISTGVGDPSVATYVDGVPQLRISSTNLSLNGVERIEFLRGPQGTLFGRNSIGGVIKIETRRPSNVPSFEASATLGNYDLRSGTASYTGPIQEDTWFFDVSATFTERDGYSKNTITGNDVDSKESTFLRGKVLYTPDEFNEIAISAYHERSRDGGFALNFLPALEARPHTISQDFEGLVNRDITNTAITWTHYGDSVDITSVTGITVWDIGEASDFDFSALDGIRRFTAEEQASVFQEIRISSPEDMPIELNDRMNIRWLAGVSGFWADSEESVTNVVRPAGAPILMLPAGAANNTGQFDSYGLAIFGQASLSIDERLDFTLGLRYDHESKDAGIVSTFDGGGGPIVTGNFNGDETFDEFAPKFSAAYDLTEDAMVYGSIARGFKAGGFNLTAPAGSRSFDTETSWTYEAGIKTTMLEERVIANAAVFYIDWDDLQLSLFDPVGMSGYTANAGQATSVGFEFDVNARVSDHLDVFAGFGFTDATFDSFTDQFGNDVSGRHLAFVPETTTNIGAQLHGPLSGSCEWFVRGDYVHTGTYHLDAANTQSEDFGLANFRVGVRWPNVSITGWIRNAFDEDYVQVAFQPNPADPTVFVGENGAPQTFGITVGVTF